MDSACTVFNGNADNFSKSAEQINVTVRESNRDIVFVPDLLALIVLYCFPPAL